MTSPIKTINDFYKALLRHDWSYQRSDDSSVYCAGRDRQNELIRLAQENGDEWSGLYDAMVNHINYQSGLPTYRGLDIKFDDGKFFILKGERIIDEAAGVWQALNTIDLYMNEIDNIVDLSKPTDLLNLAVKQDTNVINAKERFNDK